MGIGSSLKKAVKKIGRQIKRSAPDIASGGLTLASREAGDLLIPDVNLPGAAEAVVMPMADDEEVARARRRALIAQRQRSGRQSTMLTSGYPGETLG